MDLNILDLNDDCIAFILKCLPIDNHMNFAQVCPRFRYICQDYRMLVYKRLELGDTTADGFKQELLLLRQIAPHVKHLVVNLNRHFAWNEIFMTKVLNGLKSMINLERVILWIKDNEPYETLQPFIQTLEHLSNMKGLATYQDTKIVDILYQFSDCKKFRTESKMSRSPLIEYMECHTKIRLLTFNNAPIHSTLTDLVKHSTCINELSFRMTQRPEEYTPLAELPKLQKLQIFGNWQSHMDHRPDLMPLVAAVSSKLSHQLRSLTINAPGLGYAETLQIIRIKGLQVLDCNFSECQCLELLVHLKELTHLHIHLPSSQNFDRLFLNLVENCQNLKVLTIDSPSLNRNVLLEAFNVLQRGKDSRKTPNIVMLGDKAIKLDQETRKCLTINW
ncbi:uncharacterized protein LOC117786565 [Drosophila innubila]|uniref:uncharacterized protein LOC117786565 n=1 Tax=Drosophila innubila TaxID=198719 RepID=UPI00148BBB98|nr:uncharacterized protein LOC117786565 [Drosophila innubila]